RLVEKWCTRSTEVDTREANVTPSGTGPSHARYSGGAPTARTRMPAAIPSFLASGVPEYSGMVTPRSGGWRRVRHSRQHRADHGAHPRIVHQEGVVHRQFDDRRVGRRAGLLDGDDGVV